MNVLGVTHATNYLFDVYKGIASFGVVHGEKTKWKGGVGKGHVLEVRTANKLFVGCYQHQSDIVAVAQPKVTMVSVVVVTRQKRQ